MCKTCGVETLIELYLEHLEKGVNFEFKRYYNKDFEVVMVRRK